MMLVLKILAMWSIVSIASGLVIAPIFARRIRIIDEAETESAEAWLTRHKFHRWDIPRAAASGDVTASDIPPLPTRSAAVTINSMQVTP